MRRRALAAAMLLACATLAAQESAASRASGASQATPLAAPSAHPLHRGWLKELLDRDLAGAREAYEEAGHGGGSTSREQQALALARLAELDLMIGRGEAVGERRDRLRALGEAMPPPARDPLIENPAARALEELTRELAQRAGEVGHGERVRVLRERIAAAVKGYNPRPLMRFLLQQRRPGLRGPQQARLTRLDFEIAQADQKGNRELAEERRAERAGILAEFRTPSWRQRPLRSLAIEVVAKRLDKKDASAQRGEDLLREIARPTRQQGRAMPRPNAELPAMLRTLEDLLRPDSELQKEERATLQRCQARVSELLAAGKREDAIKLLWPLSFVEERRPRR